MQYYLYLTNWSDGVIQLVAIITVYIQNAIYTFFGTNMDGKEFNYREITDENMIYFVSCVMPVEEH